jgi:Domain of unknown function (DUF6362)
MNRLSCSQSCSQAVPSCSGNERPSVGLEQLIIARLEDAGRVLLALPMRGHSMGMRTGHPDVVHEAIEAYGWNAGRCRPAVPSARQITLMDEALVWLRLIPETRPALRRIVGRRMLVHPVNDKHLYSWRDIGRELGISHNTAEVWHRQGIDAIAFRLRALSLSV